MIFVIKHHRKSGISEWIGEYSNSEMEVAQQLRFETELASRNDEPRPEIVVLSAHIKDDLRRTHAKYFGLDELRKNIEGTIIK